MFVVFDKRHFFHLNAKLANLNQFSDRLGDCYHLVVISPHNTDLDASSGHQSLKI
jgi:hypothetical protein